MLRVVTLAALAGAIPASAGADPDAFLRHHDGFLAVDLPSGTTSSDNETFLLNRGGMTGKIALTWSTPHVLDQQVACAGNRPTYRVQTPRLFAYSCIIDADVLYHIEKYGRTYRVGASAATETVELNIVYPAAQRADWDPIVARMSRSLRVQAQKR